MHADLSRWTFRPEQHYSRVIVQQGRVSLDADANAEASIVLHYLRALAADLIGAFGGPHDNLGFVITTGPGAQGKASLSISPGHYYVDGLLAEADGSSKIDYFQQPDGYGALSDLPDTGAYLVWLKLWERYISAVEDPGLREVALGLNGPDTAGRTRMVWQVLASAWPLDETPTTMQEFYGMWANARSQLFPEPSGRLMAQANLPLPSANACILPPTSGYVGPENQLYRVEIHRGGQAAAATETDPPTFMFSREDGSVIAPVTGISGTTVSVTTLGRDPQLSIDVGNYVEVVDDVYASQGEPGPFLRSNEPLHLVTAVDPVNLTVTLDSAPQYVGLNPALHPYLRRWDQDQVLVTKAGLTIDGTDQAIQIAGPAVGQWIDLEDGVQVQFSAGTYRAGDYWMIPARVVTGTVDWPSDANGPLALLPEGVRYHLAPLAFIPSPGGTALPLQPSFAPQTGVSLPAAQAPEGS